MAGDQNEFAPVIRERVVHGQAGALYSRQTIEAFFKLAIERGQLWPVNNLPADCSGNHDASLDLVSEILVLEFVEAARQHGCAGHQHNGKRGLHDQQRFARERRTVTGAAARSAQRIRRISAGGKPCRRRPEDDSRDQSQNESETQHQQAKAQC